MFLELSMAVVGGLVRSLLELKEKPGMMTVILSMIFGLIGMGIISIWWIASPIEAVLIGFAGSELLDRMYRLIKALVRLSPTEVGGSSKCTTHSRKQ